MRIGVAMSGGMDSAATALMLKEAGHDVVGLFLRLHELSDETRSWAQEWARLLEIPLIERDVSVGFRNVVIEPFIAHYTVGLTPSPCPLCNFEIKFKALLEETRRLGLDRLATGHYARILEQADGPALAVAEDPKKDQTYFLFTLTKDMLRSLLLPLGDFTKTQVKDFLTKRGFPLPDYEESQELCFTRDKDYRTFLGRHGVIERPGPILDTHGNVLGEHRGLFNYTVGQRKGIGICGPEPLYVLRLIPERAAVVVGVKEQTRIAAFRIGDVTWHALSLPGKGEQFGVKVRSTARIAPCVVAAGGAREWIIHLEAPQSAITPGQAAVLYRDGVVVGGGWIQARAEGDADL